MRVFLYPRIKSVGNPYLEYLSEGLSGHSSVKSIETPGLLGVFDLRMLMADIVVLNWIENLPLRRFGTIQSLLFLVLFELVKRRSRIVYINHNDFSRSKSMLGQLLINVVKKNSEKIITHSRSISGSDETYYPHPLYFSKRLDMNESKQYDILIWGSNAPYKGIDEFVRWHKESQSKLRVMILTTLRRESEDLIGNSNYIDYHPGYVDNDKLESMLAKSELILFNYQVATSSGALMWTLGYGCSIVARKVGEFCELERSGYILGYDNLSELENILAEYKSGRKVINRYVVDDSWSELAKIIVE